MRCLHLVLVTSLVLAGWAAHAELDRSQYTPATLEGTHKGECVGFQKNDYTVDSRSLKLSVPLEFRGAIRTIKAEPKELIRYWAKAFSQPPELVDLYAHEIQVLEGKRSYWVPFQKGLVEALKSELPHGGSVRVFLVYAGCIRATPVFLATEFETVPPAR